MSVACSELLVQAAMSTKAFGFNSEVKYRAGAGYPSQLTVNNLTRVVISTGPNETFFTQFPDIWQKYRLPPVKSKQLAEAWNNSAMAVLAEPA